MESDLRRFCGIRYTDRWRFGADGQRLLTRREIWVQIDNLSDPHSAIARMVNDGKIPWSIGDHLMADVWSALAKKKHPARPKSLKARAQQPDRDAAIERARANEQRRQEAIRRGEIK